MPWFMTPFGPQYVIEPGTVEEFERRDYVSLTAQQAADYFAGVAFPDPPSFATEAEVPGIVAGAIAAGTGPVAEELRAAFARPDQRPFAVGNIHGPGDPSNFMQAGGTMRGPAMRNLSAAARWLKWLFVNYGPDDTSGPVPITFGCSIEQAGLFTPLTFGGRLTTTLDPGGQIWSDPVLIDLVAGFYWPRSFMTMSGNFLSTFVCSPALGEGAEWHATTPPDLRNGGAIQTLPSYPGWGPVRSEALTLPGQPRLPVIGVMGDSIVTGTKDSEGGESVTTAQGYPVNGLLYREFYRGGWVARGLADRVPLVQVSKGGQTASAAVRRFRAGAEMVGCDHAISGYGTNDFQSRTVAQVQADWLAIWRRMAACGPKVWQSTLMPVTTSTDSWATTANQTPNTGESKRVQLNDWLRAGAPVNASTLAAVAVGTSGALLAGQAGHPLSGYLETADLVESARNSGRWKVDGGAYTPDGTHPNARGYNAAGAVLADLSRFALPGLTIPA